MHGAVGGAPLGGRRVAEAVGRGLIARSGSERILAEEAGAAESSKLVPECAQIRSSTQSNSAPATTTAGTVEFSRLVHPPAQQYPQDAADSRSREKHGRSIIQ